MEISIEEYKKINREECQETSAEMWATWCEGEESWME